MASSCIPGGSKLLFAALVIWPLSACGSDEPLETGFAGSKVCADCHEQISRSWSTSHHGLAERPLSDALDRSAFPSGYQLTAKGKDGEQHSFDVHRVIGVKPLRQYLIEDAGGRYQVAAESFDPRNDEWFNVFGDENRQPHEWGFWANRGMTWNSMCADCHNTALEKRYDFESDRYDTRFEELGVGCEACHGPSADHADWQQRYPGERGDPTLARLSRGDFRKPWVDTCGGCHSLRSELVEVADRTAPLLESFLPEFPNLTETFYPDGQVHGEDYEYAPFLLSRMYHKNVTCLDCHEPHSARLVLPGNELCMSCHLENPATEIPAIDPAEHAHHDLSKPGGQCVDCHMPLTTYMQRHPRRDHGFTIPDPFLTQQTGVPNACNRCHADQTVEWALLAVEDWYGERMNRPSRARALRVAKARRDPASAVAELIAALPQEEIPAWRAVTASLLGGAPEVAEARRALARLLQDDAALVRSAAARALPHPAPETRPRLRMLLEDPGRAVRVTAAWTLRAEVDLKSRAGRELLEYLELNSDQPSGAMMFGSLWLERGEPGRAIPYFERASLWEPNVAAPHQNLALALSAAGRSREALSHCEEACRLEPDDPELWFSLGLAHAELGDANGAVTALERATSLDPKFARAFYNLGLARNQIGRTGPAVAALEQATAIAPETADFWFGLAAVLRDSGQTDRAIAAAEQALRADPAHAAASSLLRSLR